MDKVFDQLRCASCLTADSLQKPVTQDMISIRLALLQHACMLVLDLLSRSPFPLQNHVHQANAEGCQNRHTEGEGQGQGER